MSMSSTSNHDRKTKLEELFNQSIRQHKYVQEDSKYIKSVNRLLERIESKILDDPMNSFNTRKFIEKELEKPIDLLKYNVLHKLELERGNSMFDFRELTEREASDIKYDIKSIVDKYISNLAKVELSEMPRSRTKSKNRNTHNIRSNRQNRTMSSSLGRFGPNPKPRRRTINKSPNRSMNRSVSRPGGRFGSNPKPRARHSKKNSRQNTLVSINE